MSREPDRSKPDTFGAGPSSADSAGETCAIALDEREISRRPHTTMRDVAKRARVSLMTVSNVINRKPGTVTAETKARVEQAINELNYRPHFSGRNLRLSTRLSVGLIVVSHAPNYMADPFTSQVVAGLSNHLNEGCYSLTLQGLRHENFTEALCIQNLRTDGLCGLIGGPQAEREACVDVLRKLGLPIVLFEDWSDVSGSDVCAVRQDNAGGAAALASHVIARGARRIMMVVPEGASAAVEQRVLGVSAVVAGESVAAFELLRIQGSGAREVQAALERRFAGGGPMPDAILGANDAIGLEAMRFVKNRGCHVPTDVKVTGFDAQEVRWHVAPLLSTVRSEPYELGVRGAAALIERIQSGVFARKAITVPVNPEFCESS